MSELARHADLWVIGLYLLAMMAIGWWVSSESRDVEGYTVGNRSLPGWAVGMSVLGTFLSSISFLALPATVYADHNWNAYVFSLAVPVAALVAVAWFIQLYRSHVRLSAYEFFEQRFGYGARLYAALAYAVLQLFRVAMVQLLVALAVHPLLGWEVEPTLWGVGLVVILYDVIGGIRAVVWTDVMQVVVLLAGALWCAGSLVLGHPDGATGFLADVPAGGFSLGPWAEDSLSSKTVLVMFLYGLSENLRNYGTDQNYIQRMLLTPTRAGASRAILLAAFCYLPISLIFCTIGTGLYVKYQVVAPRESVVAAEPLVDHAPLPADARADSVFPFFIQHELPPLARGLLVAAILAAAMSTIDSSLNSTSTVLFVDLIRRLRRGPPRIPEILTLRTCTVLLGLIGTCGAVAVYRAKGSAGGALMNDWWKYVGIAGAGLFGLFLLAWLMPRIPAWCAALAVVGGTLVVAVLAVLDLHPDGVWGLTCPLPGLLIGPTGFAVMLAIGGLADLLVRSGRLPPNTRWSETRVVT